MTKFFCFLFLIVLLFLLMTQPPWGSLKKSAVDDETIEQAIARLIAVHEADETSHLGVGESLQSHKASEIIDHAASSIIADKIAIRQVGMDKLNFDRFSQVINFESIDCYDVALASVASEVIPCGVGLRINMQAPSGDYTIITTKEEAPIDPYKSKNPLLQATFKVLDAQLQDFYLVYNTHNPFVTTVDYFGFKTKYTEPTKVYAVYRSDTEGEVETELVGFSPADIHTYRVEAVSAGATLNFYVDDVLICSKTPNWANPSASNLFTIAQKSQNEEEYVAVELSNLLIQQDY